MECKGDGDTDLELRGVKGRAGISGSWALEGWGWCLLANFCFPFTYFFSLTLDNSEQDLRLLQ